MNNYDTGQTFQQYVRDLANDYFSIDFEMEVAIPIGEPAKNHRFDCVSKDKHIVIECKSYTWTETGNVPSAKMAFINEGVSIA